MKDNKQQNGAVVYVERSLKGHNLCFLLAKCDRINFWDAFICHPDRKWTLDL